MAKRPPKLLEDAILRVLKNSDRVLSGHVIARRLADGGVRLQPSQTFRVLYRLCHKGLVHRVELANGFVAGNPNMHAHFVCKRCGSLSSLPMADEFTFVFEAARKSGFTPRLAFLELSGKCVQCTLGPVKDSDESSSEHQAA